MGKDGAPYRLASTAKIHSLTQETRPARVQECSCSDILNLATRLSAVINTKGTSTSKWTVDTP